MERMIRGGIARLSGAIERDLRVRETGLQLPHIKGLSDFAASVLPCRSVNTSEIAAVLTRAVKNDDSRYRMINRWLQNPMIDPLSVMSGFVGDLIDKACEGGKTAVLMLDQSKVGDGFECLMVSLRLGERALPLVWHIEETCGNIGFKDQKPLLDALKAMIPQGHNILLTGDRFYGTAALIGWCQQASWHYRLRLKGNLVLHHADAEIVSGDIARFAPQGVEALFSDFKSRGFGITKTHLKHAARIDRMILVLTIALFFAVSTAMQPDQNLPQYSPKKPIAA